MRPCSLRKFARSVSGASAVEFGLLSVPLLLFIMGTMEFGRLMWTREALQETAIVGARCMGMVRAECGTAGVYSASMTQSFIVAQGATWSVPLTASNVTLNQTATCGGLSGFSQVSLAYTFTTVVPQLFTSLMGGMALSATACFPNQP